MTRIRGFMFSHHFRSPRNNDGSTTKEGGDTAGATTLVEIRSRQRQEKKESTPAISFIPLEAVSFMHTFYMSGSQLIGVFYIRIFVF